MPSIQKIIDIHYLSEPTINIKERKMIHTGYITKQRHRELVEKAHAGEIELNYHVLKLPLCFPNIPYPYNDPQQPNGVYSTIPQNLRPTPSHLTAGTIGELSVYTGILPAGHELSHTIVSRGGMRSDYTLYQLQQLMGAVGPESWFYRAADVKDGVVEYPVPSSGKSKHLHSDHECEVMFRTVTNAFFNVDSVPFMFKVSTLIPHTTIVNLIRTICKDDPVDNKIKILHDYVVVPKECDVFQYELREIVDRVVKISRERDITIRDFQILDWVLNPALSQSIMSIINEVRRMNNDGSIVDMSNPLMDAIKGVVKGE